MVYEDEWRMFRKCQTSTEREGNCELKRRFCEQLELENATSPVGKAISDSAVS